MSSISDLSYKRRDPNGRETTQGNHGDRHCWWVESGSSVFPTQISEKYSTVCAWLRLIWMYCLILQTWHSFQNNKSWDLLEYIAWFSRPGIVFGIIWVADSAATLEPMELVVILPQLQILPIPSKKWSCDTFAVHTIWNSSAHLWYMLNVARLSP